MKMKTKILIALIVLLVLVIGTILYIIIKPYHFVVENINITGNSYLTKSEIINTSMIKHGESLILLSLTDAESRIDAMSWVDTSEVKKVWPDNITIRIEERKPLLALSYHGSFVIIDTNGVSLATRANFAEVNLPIINGYIPDEVTAGEKIMSEENWDRLMKVTDNLPLSLMMQLSEISWYSDIMHLYLNNGLEIYLGDINEFNPDKLELLPEIIDTIEDVKEGYLDLSGIYTVFRSFN
ncbi:MAG: cell division protein FtsQ/DivIB [Clostridia bacterium]